MRPSVDHINLNKHFHCIEILQEFMLTKEISTRHITLIEFQQYVGKNIKQLSLSIEQQDDNLRQISPKEYTRKSLDKLFIKKNNIKWK